MLTEALAAAALAGTPQSVPPDSAPIVEQTVSTRTVTLQDVLRRARTHAPSAAIAEAQIELGEAERRAARPLLPDNPSLYVGAGARSNPLGSNVEFQAQLSQPLEIAGERGARRRSATARRDALKRAHAARRWQAEVEARAAFRRALLARQRAETAQTAEAFATRVASTTRTLVDAGQESPLRLRLAEAEVARAAQAHLDARYRYRAACNDLAKIVGWPLDERITPKGDLPPPSRPSSASVPDVVQDHVLTKTAKAEVQAAKAERKAARRDAWPHPTIGAYMATEREPGTPFRSQVGLASISIPIPLWRRNQGARARADAQLRIAEARATVVQRNLARDLDRTRDAVSTAADRLSTYTKDVLPRFSDNLAHLQRSFELGEIELLEVFVARERFLRLQTQALDVYEDYIAAVREYELAAGQPL